MAVGSGTTLKADALSSAASVGSSVATFMRIRKRMGSPSLHLTNEEVGQDPAAGDLGLVG